MMGVCIRPPIRPNYSFKGNADVSGLVTYIRRRVPLTQALGRVARFDIGASFLLRMLSIAIGL